MATDEIDISIDERSGQTIVDPFTVEIRNEEHRHPSCTCTEDCPIDCKGECGCEYCKQAYADFLSWDRA